MKKFWKIFPIALTVAVFGGMTAACGDDEPNGGGNGYYDDDEWGYGDDDEDDWNHGGNHGGYDDNYGGGNNGGYDDNYGGGNNGGDYDDNYGGGNNGGGYDDNYGGGSNGGNNNGGNTGGNTTQAPDAPTGLRVSQEGPKMYPYVLLEWDHDRNATEWIIYRKDGQNGTYRKIGSNITSSYADEKIQSLKIYYYKVKAKNSGGESAFSEEKGIFIED